MSHGKLTFDQSGIGSGFFKSLRMKLFFKLDPRSGADAGGPNSDKPSHDVYISDRADGGFVKGGGAWLKKGDNEPFYSITFDDPDLASPLNVTAFKTRGATDPSEHDVVWRRPKQRAA